MSDQQPSMPSPSLPFGAFTCEQVERLHLEWHNYCAALRAELSRLQAENEALRDSVAAKADSIDRLGEMVERLQAGGQGVEPVQLQHMAVAEGGVLRWMTGRKIAECELYAMPDFGRAPKLYPAPPATPALVPLTDEQVFHIENEHHDSMRMCAFSFRLGIRAAEAHYGINGLTVGGDGGV